MTLLFLTVSWVGLRCVIVVFPDCAHLLLDEREKKCKSVNGYVANSEDLDK